MQATMSEYSPCAQEVATFAKLCVHESAKPANERVDQLVGDGLPVRDVYLNLIAGAARHLGWMWEQDEADFSQVTLGLMRLQQITHRLGYEYQSGPQTAGRIRRMMIASAPGSQHLLGLSMVSEFFRKDGWQVVVEIADNQAGLMQTAKNEWFDLIGLSVALTNQVPALAHLVAQLKSVSRNPEVPVILGGAAFIDSAVTAQDLGADGISTDAANAVSLGACLVAQK
jgi:methanogenic corrinoid protein MtbC1